MSKPLETYKKRKEVYSNLFDKQNKKISKITNMRLIVALAGIVNIGILYIRQRYSFIYYILLAYIVLFTYLVIEHNKLKYNNKYFDVLNKINEDGLQRLQGDWNKFKDTGLEFEDNNHSFSSDLDIFGQGSLFQYINTTTTYMGRNILNKYLTKPCKTKKEIIKRQNAIKELSDRLSWRQRFMAEGLMIEDKSSDNEDLYNFYETEYETYRKPWIISISRIIPIIMIGFILLYIFKIIPFHILILIFAAQSFIFIYKFEGRSKNLNL